MAGTVPGMWTYTNGAMELLRALEDLNDKVWIIPYDRPEEMITIPAYSDLAYSLEDKLEEFAFLQPSKYGHYSVVDVSAGYVQMDTMSASAAVERWATNPKTMFVIAHEGRAKTPIIVDPSIPDEEVDKYMH